MTVRLSTGRAAEGRRDINAQKKLPAATATNLFLTNDANGNEVWGTVPTATLFQIPYAGATDMESATSTTLSVNPLILPRHPLVPKAWAYFGTASATGLIAGYNVSSVERRSPGRYTVTFTTPFSSSDYADMITVNQATGLRLYAGCEATGAIGRMASAFDLMVIEAAPADPDFGSAFFFGDQ